MIVSSENLLLTSYYSFVIRRYLTKMLDKTAALNKLTDFDSVNKVIITK